MDRIAVFKGSRIRYNRVQCHWTETFRLMISAQLPTYNWISFKQDFFFCFTITCLLRYNVILSASKKSSFLMKVEICFVNYPNINCKS